MNTQSNQAAKNLTFNKIKSNRHSASGVFKDKYGNLFDLEVKGTDFDYVKKFLDYQLKKKKGKGIQTSITPLSRKKQKISESAVPENKQPVKKKRLHKQKSWQGLSLAVQVKDLQSDFSKPHNLRVTIDPDIDPGEDKQMNFTILGQEVAEVECTVNTGKISCELFEFTDLARTVSQSRQKIEHISGVQKFVFQQSKAGGKADWNFRVIGEMKSNFSLALDLKISG